REVEPGLEVVVRRGAGFAPITAEEGELVAEGPPAPWVEDLSVSGGAPQADGEVHYAVFTRSRRGGVASSAVATAATLTPPAAPRRPLRRSAAAGWPAGTGDGAEPGRVALLFQVLDVVGVADALLDSTLPQARGWAVRRLGAALRRSPQPPGAEALLWRSLQ